MIMLTDLPVGQSQKIGKQNDIPLSFRQFSDGFRQKITSHNDGITEHIEDMICMKIPVHNSDFLQLLLRNSVQRFLFFPLPCILVVNTVGFIFQNPGTKTTKLVLDTRFGKVFQMLTSLRSHEGECRIFPFRRTNPRGEILA